MQPSDFMMEAQQQVVGDGEQRAFQSSENGQLVFRPFNGSKRGTQRFHFLAAMKRFRSNQQVRNFTRFQAANIIASNVFTEVSEPSEQQANVPGRNRLQPRRIFWIANFPAAFAYQPFDKRDDGFGQALIDGSTRDSHAAVRTGAGSAMTLGWLGSGGVSPCSGA